VGHELVGDGPHAETPPSSATRALLLVVGAYLPASRVSRIWGPSIPSDPASDGSHAPAVRRRSASAVASAEGGQSRAPAPISGMDRPVLVPIEYRGELVALVSPQRVYIVSSRLRVRAVGDPELRFVALMCACCGEVLNGRLPGPYTSALGVAWAKRALLTDDEPSGREESPRT
jgi:hypothetical protein